MGLLHISERRDQHSIQKLILRFAVYKKKHYVIHTSNIKSGDFLQVMETCGQLQSTKPVSSSITLTLLLS